MAATKWKYEDNQFDNATKKSNKLMNRISSDHDSKLEAESANPDILKLHNRTRPFREDFSACYVNSISANAVYKGRTSAFDIVLKNLSSTKVEEWDDLIRIVFKKDTPTYIELFPRGRKPFQSGTYDQRIEEVLALGERLSPYAALAAVKTDVDNFGASMVAERNLQQQKEKLVSKAAELLETSRINMANMMYGNLGILMDLNRENPSAICGYFDLEAIRNVSTETNVILEGPIAGGDSLNAASGVTPDIEYLFANPGVGTIAYFTSKTADGVYSGTGIEVAPGETITKKASELGDPAFTFLNVTNLDPDNQGYYSITVM
jgi:hypothetical protein